MGGRSERNQSCSCGTSPPSIKHNYSFLWTLDLNTSIDVEFPETVKQLFILSVSQFGSEVVLRVVQQVATFVPFSSSVVQVNVRRSYL